MKIFILSKLSLWKNQFPVCETSAHKQIKFNQRIIIIIIIILSDCAFTLAWLVNRSVARMEMWWCGFYDMRFAWWKP